MGSYVSHIAHVMQIDLSSYGYEECPPGRVMGARSFSSWSWITTTRRGTLPPIYTWKTNSIGDFPMPIQCPPIDFDQPATWRLQAAPAAQPADVHQDVHMEDAVPPQQHIPAADDPPAGAAPYQWAQMYERVAHMHDMMGRYEDRHGEYLARFDQIESGQVADRARLDDIYARQTQIQEQQTQLHERQAHTVQRIDAIYERQMEQGHRFDQMYDLVHAMHSFHFGGQFGGGGADDDDAAQ